MVFAMTACGGESAKVYAGYYSADIPDSFTVNEYESEFARDSADHPGSTDKIKVMIVTGDAEEEINGSIDFWGGSHQRVDDVTYGDITWKVETFTWDDQTPSCSFYADVDDTHYVNVTFYMLGVDSEEVTSVMESFTLQDDAYNKNQEFLVCFYPHQIF
jgi:hypothetical protein